MADWYLDHSLPKNGTLVIFSKYQHIKHEFLKKKWEYRFAFTIFTPPGLHYTNPLTVLLPIAVETSLIIECI